MGAEAASLHNFGKPAARLDWSEAALLPYGSLRPDEYAAAEATEVGACAVDRR